MAGLFRICLAVVVTLVTVAQRGAAAAEIAFAGKPGVNIITVVGEIVAGDYVKFEQVADQANSFGAADYTVVVLSSNGGALRQGLAIGATIRSRKFDTMVYKNNQCASVCGLIWLAGRQRGIYPSARVGFHAAWVRDGDAAAVTGSGNALVGAYMRDLGYDLDVIEYVTSAAPEEMDWLKIADARRLGIAVSILDETPAVAQQAPPTSPVRPTPAAPPSVASLAPSTVASQAYVDGRKDRIDTEEWFKSQPGGDIKDGIEFWAANRNLKIPPTCTQPGRSASWLYGCTMAQTHFANIDRRRRAEPDYKAGWNSL